MPYCTILQVEGEVKISTAFSAATEPTATKVGEIMAETDAMIDSVLRAKYALPITDADDLLVLRRIALALTCERLREIMGVQTQNLSTDQQYVATTADKARADLKAIQAGKMQLNSSPAQAYDGSRSYARENGLTPVFKKNEVQW